MEELKLETPVPASTSASILRRVPTQHLRKLSRGLPLVIIAIIVLFGVLTGIVISSRSKNTQIASQKAAIAEESLSGEQKQSFNQTFRDSAEGTIEKNDELDKYAQGTHKLVRPGGEDQTAFLTSSVLDLDQFVGKKVKVFGETFGSSQVGWLMDVGKVEVQ